MKRALALVVQGGHEHALGLEGLVIQSRPGGGQGVPLGLEAG